MTKTTRPDRWTPEEGKKLIELLDAGHTVDQVVEILNKRPWGVICEVSRQGRAGCYRTVQDKRKELKHAYWDSLEGCLRERIVRSRGRAKHSKKQYPFDLTYEDLLEQYNRQKGLCYYTDKPMTLIPNHPDVISVDRVDSSKGYTKDNVVLCCWFINYMKQDLSVAELEDWCTRVVAVKPSKKRMLEIHSNSLSPLPTAA